MSSSTATCHDILYPAPIGPIGVILGSTGVERMDLRPSAVATVNSRRSGKLAQAVYDWLDAYFRDPGVPMHLPPLQLAGSHHQRKVWQALQGIAAGRVRHYKDLAVELGSSPRAIGQACRTNPLPLLIPCHRVIAVNGLGGFMGGDRALDIKRWLLAHEGAL